MTREGLSARTAWALVAYWLALSGFVGVAISLACKIGLAVGHPWAVALPVGALMGGLMGLAIPATARIARREKPKLPPPDRDYIEALRELDAEFLGGDK